MAEGVTHTFTDPDGYAAAFGDSHVNLTITGAGDFTAQLTRLKLQDLELYRCRENLPRIAYISFPPGQMTLSFPLGRASPIFGGFVLRNGEIVFHGSGERVHQRSNGVCQWGLMSLSAKHLACRGEALTGRPIVAPHASEVLRPARAESLQFQLLFRQACRLAETENKLIERPEVTRALEQELLHAVIHCLATKAEDAARTRHQHAALMVRFEEALRRHIDQKLSMPTLCAELDVAERTLRMCCAEFLGVSPSRYLLLQRLNRARAALRRATPSTASVAEVARNNQFLEFGRFAVTYRSIFGESPSTTLQRGPPEKPAEFA